MALEENGPGDFWFKIWPIWGTIVTFIAAVSWGASELYGKVDRYAEAVDSVKKDIPPGSITIIQDRIERLGEEVVDIKRSLREQDAEREKMIEIMREQKNSVDSVLRMLIRERRQEKREKRQ